MLCDRREYVPVLYYFKYRRMLGVCLFYASYGCDLELLSRIVIRQDRLPLLRSDFFVRCAVQVKSVSSTIFSFFMLFTFHNVPSKHKRRVELAARSNDYTQTSYTR